MPTCNLLKAGRYICNVLRQALPFPNLTGNGCHAHVSLWSAAGANVFADEGGELGLSATAYNFIGGLIHSADALAAITNPTVNSYKRINAPRTRSGATWSPNTVTYAGNNRTHMIRIPDAGRFEFRLADGAVNPYLLQAGLLAVGLDGIRNKRDPGKRLDIDMYADGHLVKDAKRLPLNLLDALRTLEGSEILRAALGEDAFTTYLKLRREDWNAYASQIIFTSWLFTPWNNPLAIWHYYCMCSPLLAGPAPPAHTSSFYKSRFPASCFKIISETFAWNLALL
jgi:glutamine synthetase